MDIVQIGLRRLVRGATVCGCVVSLAALPGPPVQAQQAEGDWIDLFNGRDLAGWIVKITGEDPGIDPYGTFRVEDGLLTVGYEHYGSFEGRFGHLFYHRPFESYVLRVEYRFIGEQIEGGPGWAFKNSGVMFHAQSPESMTRGQDFPISLEAQFLGGNGTQDRPTGNLCTPGTHVEMDGDLIERHCVPADAPTFHGGEWVTVDIVVNGSSVRHLVEGRVVLEYEHPAIGGGEVNGHDPTVKVDGTELTGGYIALQSESHPIQFRSVRLRDLSPGR